MTAGVITSREGGLVSDESTTAPGWAAPSWDEVVQLHSARVYRLA
ncbi:MAG: hypothetical protein QOK42_691, partial [Frankiaceae bacterium]|nr:hypothetical protein [Frankiaceae bacterium]